MKERVREELKRWKNAGRREKNIRKRRNYIRSSVKRRSKGRKWEREIEGVRLEREM